MVGRFECRRTPANELRSLRYGVLFPAPSARAPEGSSGRWTRAAIAAVALTSCVSSDPVPEALIPAPSTEDRAAAAGWLEGRPWRAQHEDINAIAAAGGVELVFLGDSITQSWGGPGRRVGAPAAEVWREFYGGRRAAGFGISGDRTQHVLWRIENGNLEGIDPAVVVLLIGTNNLPHDPPEDVAAGIRAIVESILHRTERARVLLLGVLPRGETPDHPMRAKVDRVNELVAPLDGHERVVFRDLAPVFLLADGRGNPELLAGDFLHLRPAGYRAWAEAIEPDLVALLAQDDLR